MKYYNIYHNGTRLNAKPLSKADLEKITKPKHSSGTVKSKVKTIPLSECIITPIIRI